jgi:O-antigen ligase
MGAIVSIVLAIAQDYTIAPASITLGGALLPRIAGPLEGPNQLAGYLEIVLPVLLAFRLMRHADVVLDLTLIAGTFAAVLTFSRGGLGGLAIGFATVTVAYYRPRAIRPFVTAIGAVAGALAIAFGSAVMAGKVNTARVGSDAFSGLGTRTDLWRAAWTMWREHPWLGVGDGNYELDIADVGEAGIRTHANSLYLQSLAEGGVILLGATLAVFVAVLATLSRYANSPFAIGALGATVALTAHQIVDDLFFFPKVGELWWVVIGVGLAASLHGRPDAHQIRPIGRLRPKR